MCNSCDEKKECAIPIIRSSASSGVGIRPMFERFFNKATALSKNHTTLGNSQNICIRVLRALQHFLNM